MRILFIPANVYGTGFYRCFYPGHELEKAGHYVKFADEVCFDSVSHLPDRTDFDIYVFQISQLQETFLGIQALKKLGKAAVYEIDDYYHAIPTYNPGAFAYHPSQSARIQMIENCMRAASAITVTTPELAERYSSINQNIFPLPNFVDPLDEHWKPSKRKDDDGMVTIGWAGSTSHIDDFKIMLGPLQRICRDFPNVRVEIGGCPEVFKLIKNIPEKQKRFHEFCDFYKYPNILRRFDIGLVPLKDNKFNECKSELKGLEYSILGIPYLASPLPAYRRLVKDGENGILCGRPREWYSSLSKLIEDELLRNKLGEEARKTALERSYEKHFFLWEQLYKTLIAVAEAEAAIENMKDRATLN